MRRFVQWRWLAPAAIVLAAAGFAFFGAQGAAAEGATPTGSGHNSSPAETHRGPAVGSGRENLFSENERGLPPGPNPGRALYVQGCSTCHGVNGEGTEIAPPLINAGAAAVDFYVGTGRMPLNKEEKQAPRRAPVYSKEQIKALADYVATFGEGPPIPTVDPQAGDLVQGNQLYSNNCAACHNSSGSGGSLGRGYYAPNLYEATPVEIAEAIRVGPGTMPVFGQGSLSDQQVNSITRYIETLKEPDHPGGFSLGRLGPFSEGFFAWVVGLGALLGMARWIGTRE